MVSAMAQKTKKAPAKGKTSKPSKASKAAPKKAKPAAKKAAPKAKVTKPRAADGSAARLAELETELSAVRDAHAAAELRCVTLQEKLAAAERELASAAGGLEGLATGEMAIGADESARHD